jgi:multimeric flavodoxin WrbA
MKVLIINGSPRVNGNISQSCRIIGEFLRNKNIEVDTINTYSLNFRNCIGCMKCRSTNQCVLPKDDAHKFSEKLNDADAYIIASPTYWGNMSGQLKCLFERVVPTLMTENKYEFPVPLQKGKKAIILSACTTPFPFNYIFRQSRGCVAALKEILKYSGIRVVAKFIKSGTKKNKVLTEKEIKQLSKIAAKIQNP